MSDDTRERARQVADSAMQDIFGGDFGRDPKEWKRNREFITDAMVAFANAENEECEEMVRGWGYPAHANAIAARRKERP